MTFYAGPLGPATLLTERTVSAASTNATLVATGGRALYNAVLVNTAAYAVYLKLYNTGVVPTPGAGTPFLTLGVPAGQSLSLLFSPAVLQSGLGFTMTKLPADSDTTALAAGDLISSLFYT